MRHRVGGGGGGTRSIYLTHTKHRQARRTPKSRLAADLAFARAVTDGAAPRARLDLAVALAALGARRDDLFARLGLGCGGGPGAGVLGAALALATLGNLQHTGGA